MIKTCLPFLLLLFMFGCGPKNEEVTTEQIDPLPQTEVLDSVTDANIDGVQTNEATDTPAPLKADSLP